MELYLKVISDFERVFMLQADRIALSAYVHERVGDSLCLGPPGDWSLTLDPFADVSVNGQGPASLLCCKEMLTLLGRCGKAREENYVDGGTSAEEDVDSTLLIYVGSRGRLYVFQPQAPAVYLLAYNIEELARYGVTRHEFAYTGRRLPATRGLRRTMHFLLVNECHPRGLSAAVERLKGDDVILQTPGYGRSVLRVTRSLQSVLRTWPFCTLNSVEATDWWAYISLRLVIPWYPLGCVGSERAFIGRFHANYLIVVDWYGAVYAIELCDPQQRICRVADDLRQFFVMGLLKLLSDRRRFEPEPLKRARLEAPTKCPHVDEHNVARMTEILRVNARPDTRGTPEALRRHYEWMNRTDRFCEIWRPWHHSDPNTLVIHRADTTAREEAAADPDVLGLDVSARARGVDMSALDVNASSCYERDDESDIGPRMYFLSTGGLLRGRRSAPSDVLVRQMRCALYDRQFTGRNLSRP